MEEKDTAIMNMFGFASDGARIITGRNTGVEARLKQQHYIVLLESV